MNDRLATLLLPAFLLLRGFTYLGWFQSRSSSLPQAEQLAGELARHLCDAVPEFLESMRRSHGLVYAQ